MRPGAAPAAERERQGEADQTGAGRPHRQLVADLLGEGLQRERQRSGQRERRKEHHRRDLHQRIEGERRDRRSHHERDQPARAASLRLALGRAAERAERRRGQRQLERPQHQHDAADEADQRADLLAEPDLIAWRLRRGGARERLLEPVDRGPDAGAGEMLLRVVDRRDDQPAARPGRDVAVNSAGRHRDGGAEDRLQLWRAAHVGASRLAPHQRRELVVAPEHHLQIAREAGVGRRAGAEELGGRALQHHGPIAVRDAGSGVHHRRAAHAVALQPDVGRIDERQGAQIGQRGWPAEAVDPHRPGRVAVAGHVHRQHHEAAPRQLDGERALHLARVDEAVRDQHRGRPTRRGGRGRHVEQRRQRLAGAAGVAYVLDADAARRLHEVRDQPAAERQRPAEREETEPPPQRPLP